MNTIIFYDMEFTTWPGAMDNDWAEEWQHREVVQIGAIRFNLDTMEEMDEFDIIVKPVINPELSPLFIELTGLTQKDVDEKALAFPDAFHLFTAFAGKDTTCCYGWDAVVMRENLKLNGMPDGETDFDSVSIKPWFQSEGAPYGILPKTNSGHLAEAVGVKINSIQEHNALHDVRSIAAAYRFLMEKKVTPFF